MSVRYRVYKTCRTKIHAACTVLFFVKTESHTVAQVGFEPAMKPGMTLPPLCPH